MYCTSNAAPGVRVVSVNTNKFKTSIIDISMAVPLDDKAAANALLIKLLKRSSKKYPDFISLNAKLEDLYGASLSSGISKIYDAQIISITVNCLDDRFSLTNESIVDNCIELIADTLFEPNIVDNKFSEESLALEKRLLINQIISEKDDKRAYALDKCIELMCKDEPYGRHCCGTIEEIEKTTSDDLYQAWKNLLETAIFQITVIGGADVEKVSETFASKFSSVNRHPCEIKTIYKTDNIVFERHEETVTANQGKLVMGYRTALEYNDERRYSYRVMTDILGGGTYSKLFANVREKMSLAYYCSSRLIPSKGLVVIQSGIDSDKEETVVKAVKDQLNDVIKGNFDDEILAASKRSIRESLTISNPFSLCGWYNSQILNDDLYTPDYTISKIENVTRDQVMQAASELKADKTFMLIAQEGESADED